MCAWTDGEHGNPMELINVINGQWRITSHLQIGCLQWGYCNTEVLLLCHAHDEGLFEEGGICLCSLVPRCSKK